MRALKIFIRLFAAISILYLAALHLEVSHIRFYLKPLLLLPLIAAALFFKSYKNHWFLFAALVFSWIGDILLLFEHLFIGGLIAFLVAHIFYIVLFRKELKNVNGKLILKFNAALTIFLYLITLLSFLLPRVAKDLQFPIVIYGIIISIMLYVTYLLKLRWKNPSSLLLFSGALAFVLSDSILAINKFYIAVPFSDILIMSTYLYAQGAIIMACLSNSFQSKNLI